MSESRALRNLVKTASTLTLYLKLRYFYGFPSPSAMSKSTKPQAPASFETALAELEKIVAGMEAGQMPLEQTLSAYKRGTELLQYCQHALQDAQQQVRILEANTLQNYPSADDQ